jgi:hypothetical protein
MTRLYGRALRKSGVHKCTPGGHWKMLTLLDAMGLGGIVAARTIEATTRRHILPRLPRYRALPATTA